MILYQELELGQRAETLYHHDVESYRKIEEHTDSLSPEPAAQREKVQGVYINEVTHMII